jgi:hypothetical protein
MRAGIAVEKGSKDVTEVQKLFYRKAIIAAPG